MISGEAAAGTGIGLRAPHVGEILVARPPIPWLEVHPENYMADGPALTALEQIRRDYPVSLHGVGLSLGSAERLDPRHLARLTSLAGRIEPCLVSEHLSWSVTGAAYLNHLLPLPYTEESLAVFARHVHEAQEALRCQILIENPSSYLRFRDSTITETEFIGELVRLTGCGLLCDINNVVVTAGNLALDPVAYVDALPLAAVREIHLAGHSRNDADGHTVLIDDHGSRVGDAVWSLYAHALRQIGAAPPTMIEWDTDLPALSVLLEEAHTADRTRETVFRDEAHAGAR